MSRLSFSLPYTRVTVGHSAIVPKEKILPFNIVQTCKDTCRHTTYTHMFTLLAPLCLQHPVMHCYHCIDYICHYYWFTSV